MLECFRGGRRQTRKELLSPCPRRLPVRERFLGGEVVEMSHLLFLASSLAAVLLHLRPVACLSLACFNDVVEAAEGEEAVLECMADRSLGKCDWQQAGASRCTVTNGTTVMADGVRCTKSRYGMICRLTLSRVSAELGGNWSLLGTRYEGVTSWPSPIVTVRTDLSIRVLQPAAESSTDAAACFEEGVDYPGFDLPSGSVAAGDPTECQRLCSRRFQCRHWTWSPAKVADGRTSVCHMKSVQVEREPKAGVVSGPKECDLERNPKTSFDPSDDDGDDDDGAPDAPRIGGGGGEIVPSADGDDEGDAVRISGTSYSLIGLTAGLAVFTAFAFVLFRRKSFAGRARGRDAAAPASNSAKRKSVTIDMQPLDAAAGENPGLQRSSSKRRTPVRLPSWKRKDEFGKMCEADRGRNVIRNTKSCAQKNLAKNRCGNAVPFDKTRVVLRGSQAGGTDEGRSDYINASWVSVGSQAPKVIAAQGPMEGTAGQFWQMVAEQQVSTIVTLTNVQEKERGRMVEKCYQYWPVKPGQSKKFGTFVITLLEESAGPPGVPGDLADKVTTRKLGLVRVDDDADQASSDPAELPLEVEQIHFTDWKEGELPRCPPGAFCMLVRKLSAGSRLDNLLVHCSDGCGRTGVFLALLSAMLEQQQGEGEEDTTTTTTEAVLRIRSCRMAMVSTKAQFEYLRQCLRIARRERSTDQA